MTDTVIGSVNLRVRNSSENTLCIMVYRVSIQAFEIEFISPWDTFDKAEVDGFCLMEDPEVYNKWMRQMLEKYES